MKTQLSKSISLSIKCLVLTSTILLSSFSYASEPKEIDWEDLIPWTAMFNPSEVKFNKKLDDKEVRIPGYILPLDIIGREINTFLLVPYIGACIHVPAPAPNQIVYVETKKPWLIFFFVDKFNCFFCAPGCLVKFFWYTMLYIIC